MRQQSLVLASLLAVGITAFGAAASAQVNTTGTWTGMVAPTNGGAAFWDNASLDGSNCNVGYFLLYTAGNGFGPCNNLKPTSAFVQGNAGRLGLSSTGAPNGSYLSHDAYSFKAGSYRVDFLGNIAGYGPNASTPQELWAYTMGQGGPVAFQQLYAVGSYPGSLTTSFFFTTTEDWFLGARHAYGAAGWDYSDSAMPDHGWSLFSENAASLGGQGGRMWAAYGDVVAGDQDYNDLVIEVTSTPEPASILLMVTGFIGLGVVVRRRT
jgi:hypothetical protein